MELRQWQKVCKIGGDELRRPPLVALTKQKFNEATLFHQLICSSHWLIRPSNTNHGPWTASRSVSWDVVRQVCRLKWPEKWREGARKKQPISGGQVKRIIMSYNIIINCLPTLTSFSTINDYSALNCITSQPVSDLWGWTGPPKVESRIHIRKWYISIGLFHLRSWGRGVEKFTDPPPSHILFFAAPVPFLF